MDEKILSWREDTISPAEVKKVQDLMYQQERWDNLKTGQDMMDFLRDMSLDEDCFENQCALAVVIYFDKEYEEAFQRCMQLVSRDDVKEVLHVFPEPNLLLALGDMFVHGFGTKKDVAEGIRFYRYGLSSAQRYYNYYMEQDCSGLAEGYLENAGQAACALGKIYFNKDEDGQPFTDLPADYETAYQYFVQTSDDPVANAYLGYMYLYGKGVAQSVEKGLVLLKNSGDCEVQLANDWLNAYYSTADKA